MATNNAVNTSLAGQTGTGNFVGSTSPTLVTPNLGTPSAINLTNATALPVAALPSGTLFNFQQGQLTTPVTTTSNTMTNVTGLAVTITPTSASNKILVRAVVQCAGSTASDQIYFQIIRGATPIGVGTSVGSRNACGAATCLISNVSNMSGTIVMEWLDTPATTSATTYQVQFQSIGSVSIAVNSTITDSNSAPFSRTASIISACEVHA